MPRTNIDSAMSESGLPLRPGKIGLSGPRASGPTASSTASISSVNGTRCASPAFTSVAGRARTPFARSISRQRASRTAPERCAVSMAKRIAWAEIVSLAHKAE